MTSITTWMTQEHRDLEMNRYHERFWLSFIDLVEEPSLKDKTVLDFGCGCGGFLRCLFELKPFKKGFGIDIAQDSLKKARDLKGSMPIDYLHADELSTREAVDVAFSYEVIYLLPDLDEHAQFMRSILRTGGVYYAATGCHTDNPLWPRWKGIVEGESVLPTNDYSPEDFAEAFARNGFQVAVQRLWHKAFVPAHKHRDYFPRIADVIDYYARDIIVYRFCL